MEEEQKLELKDQLKHILEEARMVLPGIQALFGFQLIAVLNEAFSKKLATSEQEAHLGAIALTVIAIGLAMAPAALHRISEPSKVSISLVKRCSSYLNWGLKTLGVAIVLDFYLVARVVLKNSGEAAIVAAAAFLFLTTVWVVLPWMRKSKHRDEEKAKESAMPRQMEPLSSKT
jgi:hypothetical protein